MPFNFWGLGGEAGALIAPAGTRIPMQQASAPFGWTSDTSTAFTDCSMRINSGSGGASGGSTNWSSWNFGGTFNVNGFGLSVAQLPAHNHGISDPGHAHGVSDPGHGHGVSDPGHQHGIQIASGGGFIGLINLNGGSSGNQNTNTSTTGISINSSGTGVGIFSSGTGVSTNNTGSGSTITPNYTTPQVKYADHIIAIKS